jgi:cell division protein FtsX
MIPQLYLLLGALVLLTTVVRIVRRQRERRTDWELIVAFVRLDFPPEQRDVAQKIAAGLAEIVGLKIKDLRPEHTLEEIAAWAGNHIHAGDLIKILYVAYRVKCDAQTSFRALVEKVAAKQGSSKFKIRRQIRQ